MLFGFAIVLCLTTWLSFILNEHSREYGIDSWQYDLKKIYRNDTYGGKTPEETWALFLESIKERDFDLASKYFLTDTQISWKERLQTDLDEKTINELVEQTKVIHREKEERKYKNQDHVLYFYEHSKNIFGHESLYISFQKNPVTNLWKISDL